MVRQDVGKGRRVSEKVVEGARGQGLESGVVRRKDRERSALVQGQVEPGLLERGHHRREVGVGERDIGQGPVVDGAGRLDRDVSGWDPGPGDVQRDGRLRRLVACLVVFPAPELLTGRPVEGIGRAARVLHEDPVPDDDRVGPATGRDRGAPFLAQAGHGLVGGDGAGVRRVTVRQGPVRAARRRDRCGFGRVVDGDGLRFIDAGARRFDSNWRGGVQGLVDGHSRRDFHGRNGGLVLLEDDRERSGDRWVVRLREPGRDAAHDNQGAGHDQDGGNEVRSSVHGPALTNLS